MQHTIGARLHDARIERGLAVGQLAEAVRLRPQVLQWLEADDFTPCGPPAYVRGYLRCVATYLDLPADEIVAEYTRSYQPQPHQQPIAEVSAQSRRPWLPMLWFMAVVVLVGAIGYALLTGDAQSRQPLPTTRAAATGEAVVAIDLTHAPSRLPLRFG